MRRWSIGIRSKSIWWMTTRKVYAQGATRVLGPEEAITRQEALRLYTIGSAGNAFMEDRIGSLEPRKYADLAVLSDDLLACRTTICPASARS